MYRNNGYKTELFSRNCSYSVCTALAVAGQALQAYCATDEAYIILTENGRVLIVTRGVRAQAIVYTITYVLCMDLAV